MFQVIRSGAESPNPLITWLPPSATRAHPEAMQGLSKSHFNSINSGVAERGLLLVARDVPITPITQEIPRILGALCQERRQRPNIYFLLHHRYVPYNRDQEAMACGQNPAHSCFGMACMLRVFTFSNTYSKQNKTKKNTISWHVTFISIVNNVKRQPDITCLVMEKHTTTYKT